MPGGDGTGPNGMGPMTGRAAGFCAGNAVPGFQNPARGWGFFGRGRGGGGRGRRNRYWATGLTGWQRAAWGAPPVVPMAPAVDRDKELQALKGQAEYLENALNEIRQRMENLEAKPSEE